jgi:ABC-type branched-subunit amino acid transport system substrate-binding protein
MVIALVAAGCGSSDSDDSGSTGGGSSAGPIKVMTYGDITGLAPTPLTDLQDGVVAAVQAVNDAGGINGRKVQLITCDSKHNAVGAANCASKAVSEDVVAVIPTVAHLDNVTTPIFEKAGIPILGADPATPTSQYSKNTACFLNGPLVMYPQAAAALADGGAKKLTIMQPAGAGYEDYIAQAAQLAAKPYGATVTNINLDPATTNFSSIAAQAVSDGQTAVYVAASPPGLFSLLGDLAQSTPGIQLAAPDYYVQTPQVMAALKKMPFAEGMYLNSYTAFPNDTSVPGVKLFREQIAKINKSEADDEGTLYNWVDGWGAMQILQAVEGDITAESVLDAMKTAKVDFQGVVPDWNYDYNALGLGCVTNDKVFEGRYQKGEIKPLNGGKAVTGVNQQMIDFYKSSFAKYAK